LAVQYKRSAWVNGSAVLEVESVFRRGTSVTAMTIAVTTPTKIQTRVVSSLAHRVGRGSFLPDAIQSVNTRNKTNPVYSI